MKTNWNETKEIVRRQVWRQVTDKVRDQVRDQVWGQVRQQVGDQVYWQVGLQVNQQVWDQIDRQVWGQVYRQVKDDISNKINTEVYVTRSYLSKIVDKLRRIFSTTKGIKMISATVQTIETSDEVNINNSGIILAIPQKYSSFFMYLDKGSEKKYIYEGKILDVHTTKEGEYIVKTPTTTYLLTIDNNGIFL